MSGAPYPGETFVLRLTAPEPTAAVLRAVRQVCGGGLSAIKRSLANDGFEWRVQLHHNDHDELAAGIRELASVEEMTAKVKEAEAEVPRAIAEAFRRQAVPLSILPRQAVERYTIFLQHHSQHGYDVGDEVIVSCR